VTTPKGEVIEIHGELLGVRRFDPNGECTAEIVRVIREERPIGPAENALLVVELLSPSTKRARYISWIGYYDIEEAQTVEPGAWFLIEPPRAYQCLVEWLPFGWTEMQLLPNHW
jgi:hypothetical protein